MAELKHTYYPNGDVATEAFETNGKKDGEYKEYYQKTYEVSEGNSDHSVGQLRKVCTYIDDKLNGEYKFYNES